MIRALLLALLLAGCAEAGGSDTAPKPTTVMVSEAAQLLYRNGCPDGGPVCGEKPILTNGLACWTVEEVTWCRRVELRD